MLAFLATISFSFICSSVNSFVFQLNGRRNTFFPRWNLIIQYLSIYFRLTFFWSHPWKIRKILQICEWIMFPIKMVQYDSVTVWSVRWSVFDAHNFVIILIFLLFVGFRNASIRSKMGIRILSPYIHNHHHNSFFIFISQKLSQCVWPMFVFLIWNSE